MLLRTSFLIFALCFYGKSAFAQQPVQIIKGTVVDRASKTPVAFANVAVMGTEPLLGATTDIDGAFQIDKVPVGRYDIQVTYVGYESFVVREVQVSSAKTTVLAIELNESATTLNEVVVRPRLSKEQALNATATLSARMLSVEEASRYAGGFDDPARLAASFAGVASNVGNNGIVVRGNSPKYLQWKMEGVEIPNPNHFADLAAFGGGGLTALSSKMLANSDFFTGAFPAEYSNALSGVFDIFMRKGNNEKYEHAVEIGLIGIDASSEGPLRKGGQASYLFNYRYSTLSLLEPLLPENGGGVSYQDLAFKFNFPTPKAGTFSVWGIGLKDYSGQQIKQDSTLWQYYSDRESQDVDQYMGAAGFSHKFFFNDKTHIKTTLAATIGGINLSTERLNDELVVLPQNRINNKNWNIIASTYVNTKFNARHTNKTGLTLTGLLYDMQLKNAIEPGQPLQTLVDAGGSSALIAAYSHSTFKLSANLTMNAGLNALYFALNGHYTIEPRLGFKWQFKPSQSISLAYGQHSRLERLNYYFTQNDNKNLDFTRARHLIAGYDLNISEYMHLKIEPYFQYLSKAPVIPDSSFSFINLQNDWFFDQPLSNDGLGYNAGVDLTLEQYLHNGFYFMLTASLFDSRYKGGDGIWRNTRYNRNFLFNFLLGREWQLGKSKQNTFGANLRLSYQGGDRYSPVNTAASLARRDVVLDETLAFSQQLPASFSAHVTFSYQINKKNTTQEIALKIINVTGLKEFYGFRYNLLTNAVDEHREAIFIPNLSYKVSF